MDLAALGAVEDLDADGAGADRLARLTRLVIALGVALRLTRYALGHPLWGDEAFLATSLIDRDLAGLLRPLEYGQVCPVGFLATVWAIVRTLGFHEYALRLFPTVCSLASLFVFDVWMRRLLKPRARLFATAIFAIAMFPIRHGGEVKPYATDLLVATSLLAAASSFLTKPERTRTVWILAAATLIAPAFSSPSLFVTAGLSPALARRLRERPSRRGWIAWGAFNVSIAASYALWFVALSNAPEASVQEGLRKYWADGFPPLGRPVELTLWMLKTHTGHMVGYPVGGANGASAVTAIAIAAAVVWAARRGEVARLLLLLGPLAPAFAAAALQLYPYGGSQRTMLYFAPAACVLAGLGLDLGVGAIRDVARRRRVVVALTSACVLGAITMLVFDVLMPYKCVYDERSREFARWFWRTEADGAELVCAKRDLGAVFEPRHWQLLRTALYQCNQAIYAEGHARRAATRSSAEPSRTDRPLRVVLYNEWPVENPAFQAWIRDLEARYALRDLRVYRVNRGVRSRDTSYEDVYRVLEFEPRDGAIAAQTPSGGRLGRAVDRSGSGRTQR